MTRLLLLPLMLLLASPAAAQLSPDQLAAATARPPAGARLPAALRFTDQRGEVTTLGAVAGGRPLALLFADYTCRHICGPGVTLTAASLAATRMQPGRDYVLAVIGLDPKDGLDSARAFGRNIADPTVLRATSLLVGSSASVAAAERALGYRAVYDAAADQFAHDASVYVFGADGRLVTLLPELGANPVALRASLAGAAPPAPTLGQQIAHLCYGLASAHGRFGTPIRLALQAAAALTVAALAFFVLRRRKAA